MRRAPSGIGSRWLGSRDPAGRARPAVAGEEGEELRALRRSPARAPAALGLLPGWALRVGALSPRPPELPELGDPALAAVEEIMEDVSRVRLFSASVYNMATCL